MHKWQIFAQRVTIMHNYNTYCVSDGSHPHCAENWTHTPSARGSYGRLAGRQKSSCLKICFLDI